MLKKFFIFLGYTPPIHTRTLLLRWPFVPQVYESSPELPKRKPQGFKSLGVLRQRTVDFKLAYPVTERSERESK